MRLAERRQRKSDATLPGDGGELTGRRGIIGSIEKR